MLVTFLHQTHAKTSFPLAAVFTIPEKGNSRSRVTTSFMSVKRALHILD